MLYKCIVQISLYYTVTAVHWCDYDHLFSLFHVGLGPPTHTYTAHLYNSSLSKRSGHEYIMYLFGSGFSFLTLCLWALKQTLSVCFWLSAKQNIWWLKSSRPYTSIHILKITPGLEAGHGILRGTSGTEIKWHHWLGIKKM